MAAISTIVLGAAALASVGMSAYGAVQARKQQKEAEKQADAQLKMQQEEMERYELEMEETKKRMNNERAATAATANRNTARARQAAMSGAGGKQSTILTGTLGTQGNASTATSKNALGL